MDERTSYIGTPAGIVLCINSTKNGAAIGYFYHAYSAEGIPITSLGDLFISMDNFFDELGFPFPSTNQRSFQETHENTNKRERMIRVMEDDELLERHGDLGTFIIRVQHRQHSSWQGTVTWVEEKKTKSFRSALELIKMIDEAVEQDEIETDSFIEE